MPFYINGLYILSHFIGCTNKTLGTDSDFLAVSVTPFSNEENGIFQLPAANDETNPRMHLKFVNVIGDAVVYKISFDSENVMSFGISFGTDYSSNMVVITLL